MERRVLGKGLDALIPKKATALLPKEFVYLPLDKVRPGKYQPRQKIEEKELRELAQSIKEKGFIQPVVVRQVGDHYEIIAGGRRYEASKLLGLNEIPTIVKNIDDKDTLIFAIVENLQRKDLNPLDEAEALRRLTDEFEFTLEDIAKFVGKDKTTVANTLRLLRLPEPIKEALSRGLISRSQARTILSLPTKEQQEKIFAQILKEGISVRELEAKVRRTSKRKKAQDPYVLEAEETLQKRLGTKVKIFNKKNNKGKVVIEYYNLDDLDRIMRRIK